MKNQFVSEPKLTRAGLYAVAVINMPKDEKDLKDSRGNFKRKHIQYIKTYVRKSNAIRFCVKMSEWFAEQQSRETNLLLHQSQ